jgi:hypothetical protein
MKNQSGRAGRLRFFSNRGRSFQREKSIGLRSITKRMEQKIFVLLHMDKGNYQMTIATIEARTGKSVEEMLED